MSAESTAGLEKKIDKLSTEIANMQKDLKALSDVPDISKILDVLIKEVESIKTSISDSNKTVSGIISKVDVLDKSKDLESISAKIDEIAAQTKKTDKDLEEVKSSAETTVLFKKVDDLLISIKEVEDILKEAGKAEDISKVDERVESVMEGVAKISESLDKKSDSDGTEVLSKKIDELQQYVAGLSNLEEKVDDITKSFDETKEIVGIIVRQLDDIERKYNKAVEDISEAAEMIKSTVESGAFFEVPSETKTGKKATSKSKNDAPILEASPATVDELMKGLLSKVKPQTEAQAMAKALDEVRDQLTTMITGQTPIIFQFGTRARELKSYPPTATLNENDIARLNKELRDWTAKLKKIASEQ